MRVPHLVCSCFFPGVFFHSRETGACNTNINSVLSELGRCTVPKVTSNSLAAMSTTFFFFFFFSHTFTFQLLDKPWSQVGVVPSSPRFLPSIFIAHRVQQSHCSSIFHRVLLTHALAVSARQFCAQEKVPTNLYEYALGGARTHETDLYQARG